MATVGVKIELEGQKEFQQGMKNCKQQTKLFDAELKNINSTMKGSAFAKSLREHEALKGKMEALTRQSELLKDRIEKSSEAFGDNDTRTLALKTQYEALQGQIEKTNTALENNKGLSTAIGAQFDSIGSKAEALGSKISGVGESLTTHLTAPILALGAASVAAFEDVDGGLDTIITKTGATGEALEEMQDIAKNISTTIPTSFDEVGSAVGEVNTRFGSTGKELEDLSTQFIEFAKLNNTDVSTSIDAVQSAMSAFGLSVEDASVFMDTLNKAGQDTGINVTTLAQQMTSNAAVLKEFGYSASDSAMFIANLNKQGLDSSTVLAGMKKALANSIKEGKSMDEALQELDDTMANASDSTEAYQKAIEIFGTKSGPAIAEACKSGRLSFERLNTSMEDYAGNVEKTFDATLDPIDKFNTSLNKVKISGSKLVEASGPLIDKTFTKLSKSLDNITKKWDSLSTTEQEQIVKIGLIVAAIGPLTVGIGKVISSVNSITTAAKGLVLFVTANPLAAGLIVTLGLLVGAFIAVESHLKATRDAIAELDDEQQRAYDTAKSYNDQLATMVDNNEAVVIGIDKQYESEKKLVDELQNITDANGRVKDGYEERAGVIANQLAEAFGIEINYQNGVIEKYDEVMTKIDEVIAKKKAEALLSANQDNYIKALQEQKQAYEDLKQTQQDLKQANKDYQKALERQEKAQQDLAYAQANGLATCGGLQIAYANAAADAEAYKEQVDNLNESLTTQEQAFYGGQATIQNYEALQLALTDSTQDLDAAVTSFQNNLISDAPISFLRQQAEDAKKYYEDLVRDFESGEVAISEEQLAVAKANSEQATLILQNAVSDAQIQGTAYGDAYAQGLVDSQGNVLVSAQDLLNTTVGGLGMDADGNAAPTTFNALGLNVATNYAQGMASGQSDVQTEGQNTNKVVADELSDMDSYTWGEDLILNFIAGITAKMADLLVCVTNVAQLVANNLQFSEPKDGPLSNFHVAGPDMMKLYAQGIEANKYLVKRAVNGVAVDVADALYNPLDVDEIYNAVRAGSAEATTQIYLNDREVTRALSGLGVQFNG